MNRKTDLLALLVGTLVGLAQPGVPARRDERGLSQSTENAVLLAGAVAIAVVVVTVIKAYVEKNLPK